MKNENDNAPSAAPTTTPLRVKTNVRAGLRWWGFLVHKFDSPDPPNAVGGVRG